MPRDWNPTARTREISIMLTEWQSETGTRGEIDFAPRLHAFLAELSCFRENPQNLRLIPSHDGTQNVVALLRGGASQGNRHTIALAGHYDTVPVANYRDLAPLACKPDELLQALLDDLRSRPLSPQEEKALADFESGDFMPGRGLLDMKSGLAAGIALLERMADDPDFKGNLLFCATPDEERNSRGMRSLRNALPALVREWDIEIIGGINLDSTSDQGDGVEGRAIYRGTIGKLLPFAYVIGQPSHASYPFEGVSAHLIGAEILRRIEANPALCDTGDGEVSPPPICLEARDFRTGYDVTTPEAVFLAFNWLFHSMGQEALFKRFNGLLKEAMEWAVASLSAHAEAFAALAGGETATIDDGFVISFEDLKARAFDLGGDAARARFSTRAEELSNSSNPLAISRDLTELLVEEARLSGPAIISGFAGLHYPPTRIPEGEALSEAIEQARHEMSAERGIEISYRNIFTGISDMSFFGHRPDDAAIGIVAANTTHPMMMDLPPSDALRFPVVNIGPWGREYHQRLERIHGPYAWQEIPIFLEKITRHIFG